MAVKATAGGTFTIAGLPAGSYGTVLTTANTLAAEQPVIDLHAGSALTVTMPAPGVVTVYAR